MTLSSWFVLDWPWCGFHVLLKAKVNILQSHCNSSNQEGAYGSQRLYGHPDGALKASLGTIPAITFSSASPWWLQSYWPQLDVPCTYVPIPYRFQRGCLQPHGQWLPMSWKPARRQEPHFTGSLAMIPNLAPQSMATGHFVHISTRNCQRP